MCIDVRVYACMLSYVYVCMMKAATLPGDKGRSTYLYRKSPLN